MFVYSYFDFCRPLVKKWNYNHKDLLKVIYFSHILSVSLYSLNEKQFYHTHTQQFI